MRKHQQKQILKLLRTINLAQSDGLYADCQEGAVSIGNYIEKIEGEGTKTVALLEEYCELLFKASKGEIKEKLLRKHMIKIENSIIDELKPNKIEIVFFPYKVSMWDSLESIYLAAKADPNCDAYVVPIPSYELNPNGTLGEMYYDGDQYPRDISVVDWRTYDIEARHPDVIFTHYAYDDNVSNATIHPDFYSKRLREHCELLVYVPYFIISGDTVDEYCGYLPGVLYAHHVIVQSETIRQSYIGYYKKFDKECGWKGRFGKAEKKFLALGSPKFDKVINTKREDCELPPEWKRLIYKPDGSRKKTILYNTHMFTWINSGEAYFKKLHSVFDLFRSRDDVVLWWRPHPNTEMNFRIKRPEWLGEYRRIVSEYICEDWGIYDDTPDLHRAIAWCDAYYGDWSSLVPLFGVAGKPIVTQDISNTENDVLLRFAEFAIDDYGGIWAFELFYDGLFKLDFENNTAELMVKSGCTPLCKGRHVQTHRYTNIHCVGDVVVCFPFFLDNIFIFNRKNGTSEKIQINRDYMLPNDFDSINIRWSVEHNGKIYAFSAISKAIIVFDTATCCVNYDTKLFEHIGLLTDTKILTKYPVYLSECSEDGIVTLIMRNCEHLINYNLLTQEVEFIATNSIVSKCLLADFDGQDYWFVTEKNEKLVKWNLETNEATDYCMSGSGFAFAQDDHIFSGIVCCGDYVLMFPMLGEKLLKFDKISERFEEYTEIPVLTNKDNAVFKYDIPKRIGNKIFAFARYNFTLYELDKTTGIITPHRFLLNNECYDLYCNNYFDNLPCVAEDTALKNIADLFAESLNEKSTISREQHDSFLDNSANKDGTAGKTIYEYACEVIKS